MAWSTFVARIHFLGFLNPQHCLTPRRCSKNTSAMWGPGGAACIISFICHVPTAMLGINSITAYMSTGELGDIYDVLPHGRLFLSGLAILGIVVWTYFPADLTGSGNWRRETDSSPGNLHLRVELPPVRRRALPPRLSSHLRRRG